MNKSDIGYKASAGETFDWVALALFGDEKYAPELICINPEYAHKAVFDGTEFLNLPIIDTTGSYTESNAPWRT